MTCHQARALLSALIDEVVTPAERTALDAHLEGCPDCRRELEQLRGTVSLLQGMPPARAPAGFVDRVVEAAAPPPWHRRLLRGLFVPWRLKLPLEAAAALMIAGLAVLVFQRTPDLHQAARTERDVPALRWEAPGPRPADTPAAESLPAGPVAQAPAPAGPTAKERAPGAGEPLRSPAAPAPAPGAAAPDRAAPLADTARPRAPVESRDPAAVAPPDVTAATPPAGAARPESRRERILAPADTPERLAGKAESEAAAGASRAAPSELRAPARRRPAAVATGRLASADPAAAERTLADLAARLGGSVVGRTSDAGDVVVELIIPLERRADFDRDIARLGSWQAGVEAAGAAPAERIRVRLTR
jgi:hypothetical protein